TGFSRDWSAGVCSSELAATEQGEPIIKAVIEALKDRKLLVPMPELLIRLAVAGRAAARRQAYRGLIRDLERPSIVALEQLLIDRAEERRVGSAGVERGD